MAEELPNEASPEEPALKNPMVVYVLIHVGIFFAVAFLIFAVWALKLVPQ